MKNKPIDKALVQKHFDQFKSTHDLSDEEVAYFVFTGQIENTAYNSDSQNINVLRKNGKIVDVTKASDHLNLKTLSKKVTKYYICYPK